MKNKKQTKRVRPEKQNRQIENETIHQWRKRFTLGRRSALRERQKQNAELERKKVFERKTSEASEKKAPVTLRTRGYYRFTREYPSTVDENGFRANQPDRKAVIRRRLITALVCILVFCAAFTVTKYTMLLSEKALPSVPTNETAGTQPEFRALHFSYEELRGGDTKKMLKRLETHGCTAAVFEFKDDYGYVLFNTGSFLGASADHRVPHASETLNYIKSRGYSVCAYISCFKDTAAAAADLSYSVRQNAYDGGNWLDNSGAGWLDPFSTPARSYVLNMISNAAEIGFDRIILDNVRFSTDSGTASPCFAWEGSSQLSRNQALVTFINSALKSSGGARLTVMCDTAAFDTQATQDAPGYYGNLLSSRAASLCVDARPSSRQKNISIDGERFSDAALMPYVFVLAASEYGVKAVEGSDSPDSEVIICIENGASLEEQLSAVGFSGADGYIIW